MRIKTLQQRITLFVLIPVFLILAGMGWASFIMARNAILKQWSETAIAKMQKASHLVDMRLSRTKNLLLMLKNDERQSFIIQDFIIKQLKSMDGVIDVKYDFLGNPANVVNYDQRHDDVRMMGMHVKKLGKVRLSLPRYNAHLHEETISLSTDFIDENKKKIGQIEVILSFEDLIRQINKETWWTDNKAFLIDNQGKILIRAQKTDTEVENTGQFGKIDLLEKQTLEALKHNSYGTLFGPGNPPKEISGYYRLNEAPWSLVLISPGEQVLTSILNFRLYYLVIGFLSIIGVILFIRTTVIGTTNAIKKVSESAKNLANGKFSKAIPVTTKDEVGELTYNFNKMTKQLKERVELKAAMSLAKEVQQSLLPPTSIAFNNFEISGRSVYCDETGGDFFDIIVFPDHPEKIYVAVGDVVGHGIGAALLMTTTRALLRGRISQGGSLSKIMNDVNRLLCIDTNDTGSFVTMFLLMIDDNKKELSWIRAGHDPAIVYHPDKNNFVELHGEGLVLGLDEDWRYTENVHSSIQKGTVVLIGTDGVWEVENKDGARFGKKRVKNILQQSASSSSEKIVDTIISEADKFRKDTKQKDDITLLAVKFL